MDFESFLRTLRWRMRGITDVLDAGVLAPPEVAAMSLTEVSNAFDRLERDWVRALTHARSTDGSTCPIDNEDHPCNVLQRLAVNYRVTCGPST